MMISLLSSESYFVDKTGQNVEAATFGSIAGFHQPFASKSFMNAIEKEDLPETERADAAGFACMVLVDQLPDNVFGDMVRLYILERSITCLNKLIDQTQTNLPLPWCFYLQRAHAQLGDLHRRLGDYRLSKQYHENAVGVGKILDEASEKNDPCLEDDQLKADQAELIRSLAVDHEHMDDVGGAIEQVRQAIRILEDIRGRRPGDCRVYYRISSCYRHMARLCNKQDRPEEELVHSRKAASISKEILAADPDNPLYMLQWAESLKCLGESQLLSGEMEGHESLDKAFQLVSELKLLRPDDRSIVRLEHSVLNSIGDAHLCSGDYKRAIAAFLCTSKAIEKALVAHPRDSNYLEARCKLHISIGMCLQNLEEMEAACESFKHGVWAAEEWIGVVSENPKARHQKAAAHYLLGSTLQILSEYRPAIEEFRKAMEFGNAQGSEIARIPIALSTHWRAWAGLILAYQHLSELHLQRKEERLFTEFLCSIDTCGSVFESEFIALAARVKYERQGRSAARVGLEWERFDSGCSIGSLVFLIDGTFNFAGGKTFTLAEFKGPLDIGGATLARIPGELTGLRVNVGRSIFQVDVKQGCCYVRKVQIGVVRWLLSPLIGSVPSASSIKGVLAK